METFRKADGSLQGLLTRHLHLRDARNELRRRLEANKGNNPCAKLFGGLKNANKALNKANVFLGKTIDSRIGATTLGKNVDINPAGGFMDTSGSFSFLVSIDLRAQTGGYVSLDNVVAAAFILAHEIGHVSGKIPGDGNDPFGFLSIFNNQRIYEACFSETPTVTGPLR